MTDPTPADAKDGAEPRLAAPAVRRLLGAVLPVVLFAVVLGLLTGSRWATRSVSALGSRTWSGASGSFEAATGPPGGAALPRILLDVSRLVTGGVLRMVSRHGGAR